MSNNGLQHTPFHSALQPLAVQPSVSSTFEVGKIYRASFRAGKTVDFVSNGGAADIGEAVGDNGHMWLILHIDTDYIYFFTLTSRFFNILFNAEVGSIKDFFDNDACNLCKGKLSGQYRPLMKVVNKYAGGKELINFDFIYLLNKMYYQFPYETLIRVNKLHRGFLPQLDKYISNREINFTLKTELRDRDKKTLASQILLNLEDNDLSKVTGANNGILKKVADIWIGI